MRAAFQHRRDAVRSQGQQGASAVEYGLVVSLIAAVLVIAVFALGRVTGSAFGSIDCWSSTGGSSCAAAAVPGDIPAEPIAVVAEPPAPSAPAAPAPSAPAAQPAPAAPPAQLCNQSGNGNGRGQGQGNCR
jgi:Flp pilus assembly pilin Flp